MIISRMQKTMPAANAKSTSTADGTFSKDLKSHSEHTFCKFFPIKTAIKMTIAKKTIKVKTIIHL